MATVFDIGILSEFSDIFIWVFVFVVVFGILLKVSVFDSRGINALIAITITIILGSTSSATSIVSGLLPWFVVTGMFVVLLMVLATFIGVDLKSTVFGGNAGLWWMFVPLIIGLVIAMMSGGQLSRGTGDAIDPETGETITSPGKQVINIITEPKILGAMLILTIASITVALMAGVPKPMS